MTLKFNSTRRLRSHATTAAHYYIILHTLYTATGRGTSPPRGVSRPQTNRLVNSAAAARRRSGPGAPVTSCPTPHAAGCLHAPTSLAAPNARLPNEIVKPRHAPTDLFYITLYRFVKRTTRRCRVVRRSSHVVVRCGAAGGGGAPDPRQGHDTGYLRVRDSFTNRRALRASLYLRGPERHNNNRGLVIRAVGDDAVDPLESKLLASSRHTPYSPVWAHSRPAAASVCAVPSLIPTRLGTYTLATD